jgi:hypothetical protein
MNEGTITWLPIEDAPKDGTIILVFSPEEMPLGYCCVSWGSNMFGKPCWRMVHGGYRTGYSDGKEYTHFAHINPPKERG